MLQVGLKEDGQNLFQGTVLFDLLYNVALLIFAETDSIAHKQAFPLFGPKRTFADETRFETYISVSVSCNFHGRARLKQTYKRAFRVKMTLQPQVLNVTCMYHCVRDGENAFMYKIWKPKMHV